MADCPLTCHVPEGSCPSSLSPRRCSQIIETELQELLPFFGRMDTLESKPKVGQSIAVRFMGKCATDFFVVTYPLQQFSPLPRGRQLRDNIARCCLLQERLRTFASKEAKSLKLFVTGRVEIILSFEDIFVKDGVFDVITNVLPKEK